MWELRRPRVHGGQVCDIPLAIVVKSGQLIQPDIKRLVQRGANPAIKYQRLPLAVRNRAREGEPLREEGFADAGQREAAMRVGDSRVVDVLYRAQSSYGFSKGRRGNTDALERRLGVPEGPAVAGA